MIDLDPFADARRFIDGIASGEINPEQVQSLLDRAKESRNGRAPIKRLRMSGDATVRRRSGLVVSRDVHEAASKDKPIMVALYIGMREIQAEDYERKQLIGTRVEFKCQVGPWAGISAWAVWVGNRSQSGPIYPPKKLEQGETLELTLTSVAPRN